MIHGRYVHLEELLKSTNIRQHDKIRDDSSPVMSTSRLRGICKPFWKVNPAYKVPKCEVDKDTSFWARDEVADQVYEHFFMADNHSIPEGTD